MSFCLLVGTFVLEDALVELVPHSRGFHGICAAFRDSESKDFGTLVPCEVVKFVEG
jgi:hypothetical protein